nr:MAG TPA: hypothetical protein [Caudoviricetes sp.]
MQFWSSPPNNLLNGLFVFTNIIFLVISLIFLVKRPS